MRLKAFFMAVAALAIAAPTLAFEARLKLPVTLSKKQAVEEIDLVARILTRMHPGVYQYQSKKQFDRLVSQTKSGINGPVNVAQVYLDLAHIVASVCDSHTQINYIQKQSGLIHPGRFRVFGEEMAVIDGKLHAVSEFGDRPIAQIAGIEAGALVKALRQRLAVDACADENALFNSIEAGIILTAMLGEGPRYAVRFADGKVPQTVSHNANPFSGFVMATQVRQYLGTHPLELKKRGFDSCERVKNGFMCRKPSESVTFLRFRSFDYDDVDETIDGIFKTILENGDDDLIIDLQDNPGGNIRTMGYFLSYLLARSHRIAEQAHRRALKVEAAQHYTWENAQNEKVFKKDSRTFRQPGRRNGVYTLRIRKQAFGHPHYRGRVTVLVNPGTVSAGVAAAAILRRQQKATIIGLPPAGSGEYSCAAAVGRYVLPHSKLVLMVPADCFSSRKAYLKGSSRMKPDIVVPVTPQNATRHPLAVLDAALAHLGKTSKPVEPVKVATTGTTQAKAAPADEPIVFLTRQRHHVKTAKDLNGAKICFIGGSEAETHLRKFYKSNDMVFEDIEVVDQNFLESFHYMGRCDAVVANESQAIDIKKSMPDAYKNVILPGNIKNSGG